MIKKIILPIILCTLILAACSLPNRVPGSSTPVTTTSLPNLDTPTSPNLPAVVSPQIISLHMLDADNGWAIGETQVMRTTDGGLSWFDATPAGVSNLGYSAGYYFLNIDTAWIILGGTTPTEGTLYSTTDGGQTWTANAVPFAGPLISFTDNQTGWAMVGLGAGMSHEAVAIFRSSDGGITWDQTFINDPSVPDSPDGLPFVGDKNGIVAVNANTALVTGAQPSSDFIYIYISRDGGVTWAQPSISMPAGYAGAMTNAFPPTFFENGKGVLSVGLYFDTPGTVFYISQDAGLTWTSTTPVVSNGKFSIPDPEDFFVWDGSSSLYVSHDAGTSWSTITPNINIGDTLSSFQFINPTDGWALTVDASSHSSLYKTTDGGTTWLQIIP